MFETIINVFNSIRFIHNNMYEMHHHVCLTFFQFCSKTRFLSLSPNYFLPSCSFRPILTSHNHYTFHASDHMFPRRCFWLSCLSMLHMTLPNHKWTQLSHHPSPTTDTTTPQTWASNSSEPTTLTWYTLTHPSSWTIPVNVINQNNWSTHAILKHIRINSRLIDI